MVCKYTTIARDVSLKQKITKEMLTFNDKLVQMDTINIYRVFHLRTPEYTFFSIAHGTLLWIDHMIGHKTSFNKFRKVEIIQSIFSNHSGLKLEITTKRKLAKLQICGDLKT